MGDAVADDAVDAGLIACGARAQVFVNDLADPEVSPDDMHHLVNVLRLGDGEKVILADGKGSWRLSAFDHSARDVLRPAGEIHVVPAASSPVCVALAAVKGERSAWAVAKLVEVNVDSIALLVTDRGIVRWDAGRKDHALQRLGRIAREAAAQARRAYVASIVGPVTLAELIESYPDGAVALAHPGGDSSPATLFSMLSSASVVAIGPEGGWSQRELAYGENLPGGRLPRISMGETIMRSETAAVVAGAILKMVRS
ncbi:MAG: 16S rRNA (uracil(1498)-N(3))-methyltransferase [Actinobacteria bacterium]|nr:16S rRNA (uracil(1498)-N(3))-methyltransferase [Actinomycetota bacterium]MCL5446038.1 16S rRNA (uracil(1498)-N(3))-methyltransferase [Actinomycetota bacterium]